VEDAVFKIAFGYSQPTKTKEILMQVSGSLGVTFYSHDDILDADQLLRQADQAMYQAKLAGKNRFHIFDVKQNEHILQEKTRNAFTA